MSEDVFVDYYDLLQLSPTADEDTIHRVFRHLAKKVHPDNADSNDVEKFHKLLEAHRVLTDPEARAGYDARYQDYWNRKWKLVSEAASNTAFDADRVSREKILSLLYVQRRRSMNAPGLGEYEMARLLRTPVELVEFHVWYLRSKTWIERTENGTLAITANGVDQVEQGQLRLGHDRLLAEHAERDDESHRLEEGVVEE